MKPSIWLRIASIISLVLAVGHTSGGLSFWSPPGETEVLRAMRSYRFDALGVSRTYLDFYLGFGFIVGIYLLMQAIALWQLASVAKADPFRVRPLIGSFLLASVVSAFLSLRFIFPVPAVSFAVVSACLGLAFFTAGKHSDA